MATVNDYDDEKKKLLKSNLANLKLSFGSLKAKVLQILMEKETEKKIDINLFIQFVIELIPSESIQNAQEIADIFKAISENHSWNYRDYENLKWIAVEFAKEETEHLIHSYKRKLASFFATTKLADYINLCQDEDDIADPDDPLSIMYNREHYRLLTVKLGRQVTETLEYISELWTDVESFFNLPSLVFFLDHVIKDSLTITWFIPQLFVEQIQAKCTGSDAEEFFKEHQIIELKIDDDTYYDQRKATMIPTVVEPRKCKTKGGIQLESISENLSAPYEDDYNFEEMEVFVSKDPMSQIPSGWDQQTQDDLASLTPTVVSDEGYASSFISKSTESSAGYASSLISRLTVDTRAQQQKFLDIILKAVIGGHKEPIERALHELNELCGIQQRAVGIQLLDFMPKKNSSISKYVPVEYSWHSPLMIACENEREDLVELLLNNGASAAFRNKDKLNALHVACKRGNKVIIDLLLDSAIREKRFAKGSKPINDHQWIINARNMQGWTPLMFAINGGHIDAIKRLIKTGQVDYHAKTRKQWNILHIASRQTNLESVKIVFSLFENNPDLAKELILSRDKGERNILHHASANTKNQEVLKWLLSNINEENLGILINQQIKAGYTPILTACEYQNTEAVKLLIAYGADVTLCAWDRDTQGKKSGLHIAAIHDAREIAELLLENECPIDAQDSEGNSALHVAYKKSSFEVIAVLRQRDDGKLEALTNKAGKLASAITHDIIPPEIKKQGKKAIKLFNKALKVGKTKIFRCNLMILGQEGVGKTSVYRLLVGLRFKTDLDPTRGIDNNDVDTFDKRYVDTKQWNERPEKMLQSKELFAQAVAGDKLPQKKNPREILPVNEDQLLKEIQTVEAEIEHKIEEASRQAIEELNDDLQLVSEPHTHQDEQSIAAVPISVNETLQELPPNLTSNEEYITRPNQPSERVPLQEIKFSSTKTPGPVIEKHDSIILSTLDFVDQPEYRLMHHCFITRRSMYLVVFNLQDMVKDGGLTQISLEEIRYWIHSVHAHIYPPDEDERGRDEKMRRVCLVGTHRAPKDPQQGREITEDELDSINELLKKELLSDDRCVDHIHCEEESKWIFVSVENSIDGTDDEDRKKSGAFQLQQKMGSVLDHLAFLQEDYPIIWLQFESELMRQREYRKERSQSMVISLEEIQSWAFQQGITDPDAQSLAFQFFHDTGMIAYLKQTPTLFLTEEEWQQLVNLVILDPAWLIKVMKVIFQMDQSFKGVPGRLVRDLLTYGIASSSLLKACWKEFTDSGPASFNQLCLMLQANCLIYPVPSLSESESCPPKAEMDPLPAGDSPPLAASTRSQTINIETTVVDKTEILFLVPCKLPPKPAEVSKPGEKLRWIEFYFDFQKFLPNEIYHRLICLFLAVSEGTKKPSGKKKMNMFYSTCCQFFNVDGCKWKIEFEKNLYRLKVSVIPKAGDKRPPSYFINKVHEEYLLKICQASHLQGLEYYGGPFVKCTNCGEEEIVEYVGYAHGEPQEPPRDDLWCTNCPNKHVDINELLKPQPDSKMSSDPVPKLTADDKKDRSKVSHLPLALLDEDSSTPLFTKKEQKTRPLLDTQSSSTSAKEAPSIPSTRAQPSSSKPLTLKTLTIIKWKDEMGVPQKPLRIIGTVSPKWKEAGRMLGIDGPQLEIISKKRRQNPAECCCDVFINWLEGTCDYPVTWGGLIELLEDLQLCHIADNLRKALNIEY